MSNKLLGIATLFAAGSILVAGTPTLGAQGVDTQASASDQDLRCGARRCAGGRRCGGGRRCASRACATRTCATRYCATRYCATRRCGVN